MYQIVVFFQRPHVFLFRPAGFSRVLGRGARRGPVCTHDSGLGPGRAPGRVLWALKVAKTNWQVITGSVADHIEPRRCHAEPVRLFFHNNEL